MTMLTPLGRGQRRRSRSRRDHTRLRAFIVLLLLVALAGGLVLWALRKDDARQATAGASPCPSAPVTRPAASPSARTTVARRTKPPVRPPAPRLIRVQVLNGTQRSGLAASTATLLRARGFRVVTVGNASGAVTTGTAQVRYGPSGVAQAVVLARYVPGARLLPDRRRGVVVDLVLGPSYRRLATAAEVARAAVRPTRTPVVTRC
jgi:hypothetical protein